MPSQLSSALLSGPAACCGRSCRIHTFARACDARAESPGTWGQAAGTCGRGAATGPAATVVTMTILLSGPPVAAAPRHPHQPGPELTVDLAAVAANLRTIASRTDAAVMAVVKADGFGHGAVDVARTALANGATWLGVTSLAEALPLRAAGLDGRMLSWLNPADLDAELAVEQRVDVAVPTLDHLATVSATRGARVHLHLDTGLARDGADPRDWAALCQAAARAQRRGLLTVVGVMGHLACADQPRHPANRAGRKRFAWGVAVARRAACDLPTGTSPRPPPRSPTRAATTRWCGSAPAWPGSTRPGAPRCAAPCA